MAKKSKAFSSYKELPFRSKIRFVGWIDPKQGGFRYERGDRSNTWRFGCQLVAWQANSGPVVHEKIYVRKERIDGASAMRLIRQTPKGRVIQFQGSRPSGTAAQQKGFWYVKLEGPIQKPESAPAIGKEKASRVSELKDGVFGLLELDQQYNYFNTTATFRGTTMDVSFDAESVDELKEMIKHAKPLWRKRQMWFSTWRKKVYRYYMANMADEWWQEDYTLTEKTFNRLLQWPVGVQFTLEEGKFGYVLTGWCEELFGDHGIDAGGSSISKMEASF